MTEKELMLSGQLYDAQDPQLVQERTLARQRLQQYNTSAPEDGEGRTQLLRQLFGTGEIGLAIEPPFYCDYGTNISFGQGVFFNFNCVVLDVAPVRIGNHVLFGPNVGLYTATHPLNADERRAGREAAKPITIEDDVWVGGNVVVNPGVTIGARSVIGAGSVVTRDIPADVFAAGNPCRVIRSLSAEE